MRVRVPDAGAEEGGGRRELQVVAGVGAFAAGAGEGAGEVRLGGGGLVGGWRRGGGREKMGREDRVEGTL